MIKNDKDFGHKYKVVFAISILLMSCFIVYVHADNEKIFDKISKNYFFDEPTVEKVEIDGFFYDEVKINGLLIYGDVGKPCLPSKGINLLIPQKTKVEKITITTSEKILLGTNFRIVPRKQPIPLSQIEDKDPVAFLNETVYNSKEFYPGKMFTEVGTYSFRGYDILVLNLHPLQYMPKSGELYYYSEMRVNVELAPSEDINPLFRGLEEDRQEIVKKVDNPMIVESYTERPTVLLTDGSEESYELLIITSDKLKNAFIPLKNAHDSGGIKTIIKTHRGASPGKIREIITDSYIDQGIEYVLIGGDDDVVPFQDLYVKAWPGSEEIDYHMASDIYYACLDGTYNFDGDDKWGEPNDGPSGGDVDLVAEVFVGRASASSIAEVENFVSKTIAYMNPTSYDDYLKKALFVGEYLWGPPRFPNITWGGNYMDELVDGASSYGYSTVGLPSNVYNITTLYERDWPGNNWPKSEIIRQINNNVHIINHLGHGNVGYAMKMRNSDVNSLTNDKCCFVYSQTCLAGHFDGAGDCFAEYLTLKTEKGAFAAIMNTRYGWGETESTDGPSQRFNREFWDAIYGENIPEIGRANHDSKEDNLYRINDPCMRWCYYCITLFGDPTLKRPTIEINNVTNGLGITATVKNIGDTNMTNLNWSISFSQSQGLILTPRDRSIEGVISKLDIGAETTFESGFIFGFGMVTISIRIDRTSKTINGFIIGPFVTDIDIKEVVKEWLKTIR